MFFCGVFLGTLIGFAACALCHAAADRIDYMESDNSDD